MEKRDYIALAAPFFFFVIGIELLVARRKKRRCYRCCDAFSDLGCGVVQQIVVLFWAGLLFTAYALIHERFRIWSLDSSSIVTWGIAFVAVDFVYYWWHRL